jgi:hypothetical protein
LNRHKRLTTGYKLLSKQYTTGAGCVPPIVDERL